MNEIIKTHKKKLAESWKDVLESFDVKGIKEISFNDAFFRIGFASKKAALNARENKFLKTYKYEDIGKVFKYRHTLIGAAKSL